MLHLIHPALVHFSVAFIIAGGAGEVWGMLAGRDAVRRWGASLALAGLVSLVPTLASGYLAANTVHVPEASARLLDAHERNGWIVLGLLFAAQFWKAWGGGRIPERQRSFYAAVMAAAVLFTVYGAWLGGRMVYAHAIGVH
jgi:uncharacterized membrane protein